MKNVLDSNVFKINMHIQLEEKQLKLGKHYAISDVHGMYEPYMEVIKKLGKDDTLFILGDAIDRGEDGIKIILDIIEKYKNQDNGPNITLLLGNHEVMFLQTINIMLRYGINLDDLIKFIESGQDFVTFYKNIKSKGVSLEEIYIMNNWIKNNHGDKTIFSYLQDIEPSKMKEIYKCLLDTYVILPKRIGNEDFLFVHAMPINDKEKLEYMKKTGKGFKVSDLTTKEYGFMLAQRTDRNYYQQAKEVGFTTICGHTPSIGTITNMKNEGYVRIDAGCGQRKENSKLALYCIEDNKVEFIDERKEIIIGDNR